MVVFHRIYCPLMANRTSHRTFFLNLSYHPGQQIRYLAATSHMTTALTGDTLLD